MLKYIKNKKLRDKNILSERMQLPYAKPSLTQRSCTQHSAVALRHLRQGFRTALLLLAAAVVVVVVKIFSICTALAFGQSYWVASYPPPSPAPPVQCAPCPCRPCPPALRLSALATSESSEAPCLVCNCKLRIIFPLVPCTLFYQAILLQQVHQSTFIFFYYQCHGCSQHISH